MSLLSTAHYHPVDRSGRYSSQPLITSLRKLAIKLQYRREKRTGKSRISPLSKRRRVERGEDGGRSGKFAPIKERSPLAKFIITPWNGRNRAEIRGIPDRENNLSVIIYGFPVNGASRRDVCLRTRTSTARLLVSAPTNFRRRLLFIPGAISGFDQGSSVAELSRMLACSSGLLQHSSDFDRHPFCRCFRFMGIITFVGLQFYIILWEWRTN